MERFVERDGVRIAYEVRGGGEARPLVLVHGLGYARWGWEPVVDGLAAGRSVALLDNRGVGASDVPPGPYTSEVMADDVLAVVDDLGWDRVHLAGASLGGMIAQQVALVRPGLVDRLVLVCTTPGGDVAHPIPAATLDLIQRMPTMAPAEALHAAVDNALGGTAGEARDRIVEQVVAHRLAWPQDPAGWQAQAHAGTTHELGGAVAGITCPTLVLHGDHDQVVDHRNAEVLGALLPDARVVVVPGGGHLWFWEQPDRFLAEVDGFLG